MKKILEPLFGFSLVGIFLILIFSFIAIIGGGIMKLFGFRYDSVGQLILFFTISGLVGFPIETVANALPKVLHEVGFIGKKLSIILFILLDTMSTFFILSLIDYFMTTVSATELSIFVYAIISALLCAYSDFKDEADKQSPTLSEEE